MINLDDYEANRYEEENFDRIFSMLLMSGVYREEEIEDQVHEILDNPSIYPEYF